MALIFQDSLDMLQNLYGKLWQNHVIHKQGDGTALIYIEPNLVHEVTSPQAFEGLKLGGAQAVAGLVDCGDGGSQYADRLLGARDRGSNLTPAGRVA